MCECVCPEPSGTPICTYLDINLSMAVDSIRSTWSNGIDARQVAGGGGGRRSIIYLYPQWTSVTLQPATTSILLAGRHTAAGGFEKVSLPDKFHSVHSVLFVFRLLCAEQKRRNFPFI